MSHNTSARNVDRAISTASQETALDEYNRILARGLDEPGRTIQREQSTGNAVANAHQPPAAGNPDQIYYDFAVKRAYANGGIRGSAFGRPEDGPTIMTPETARGGIPANGNSVGPFLTTTRLASKKIIYAKQNEDAMLLLEEHFGASMATILQDPQLQASEALKFPVDVTTKLWEIVNGCGITSLPAFHSMLHRAIKRSGKSSWLGVAVVRQLQVDAMREMSDIKEQREEARLEDRTLVVTLKASPTRLRQLGGASTPPDRSARSSGDADPKDVDGPLPSSRANTRLGRAPKHVTAIARESMARESMEKDAGAGMSAGGASGIIIIPDDDGARTPEGSPTGIIDLTISPPAGGVAAVRDEEDVGEQDAAPATDTDDGDVAMTDNANDGDPGDVAMTDDNANDRPDPAGDGAAHTATHGTRRRQSHSPPSPSPSSSRPSRRRRLNPPVTEEQQGGDGGTRWLELTPAAAQQPDRLSAEHLRRERVIKRVAVRMLANTETEKERTRQRLAAVHARLAAAKKDQADAQQEVAALRTANAELEERLEAAADDAADAADAAAKAQADAQQEAAALKAAKDVLERDGGATSHDTAALEARIAELEERLDTAADEAADAAERHQDAVRALHRRIRAAEDATAGAVADAAEELDAEWEKTLNMWTASDRKQIAEQKTQIAGHKGTIAELKNDIAEQKNVMAEQKNIIAAITAANVELRQTVADLRLRNQQLLDEAAALKAGDDDE
ncbi:hypothetical protein UCDDS831_g08675 [Diplodia seriata]|uniref:Uncharacterized protein n=1 Tax=Diplodia seriata TaxID=420778 RepID=A0A0G2G9P0_9PEZI|nr:hypothetical protein UCDDS831_g08675 [Diplodia seriata]